MLDSPPNSSPPNSSWIRISKLDLHLITCSSLSQHVPHLLVGQSIPCERNKANLLPTTPDSFGSGGCIKWSLFNWLTGSPINHLREITVCQVCRHY